MRFHSAHVVENARQNTEYGWQGMNKDFGFTLRCLDEKENALPVVGRASCCLDG
jgi:hypothetical protein